MRGAKQKCPHSKIGREIISRVPDNSVGRPGFQKIFVRGDEALCRTNLEFAGFALVCLHVEGGFSVTPVGPRSMRLYGPH